MKRSALFSSRGHEIAGSQHSRCIPRAWSLLYYLSQKDGPTWHWCELMPLPSSADILLGMARSLKSLHLRGYRAFSDFRVSDLGRVNLIVGKNNAGKTSILEAIRLLASGGDPTTLYQIAIERSDAFEAGPWSRGGSPDLLADAKQFFHDFKFGKSATFSIDSNGDQASVTADVVKISELDPDERGEILGNTPSIFRDAHRDALGLRLMGDHTGSLGSYPVIELSSDSQFVIDALSMNPLYAHRKRNYNTGEVVHINPSSFSAGTLATLWSYMLVEGREADAAGALRVLESNIESVHFLPMESNPPSERILIGLKGQKRRVALSTMGEGMRRMLALALGLANARDGVLTIDEIDTGLHWSVMHDMWSLVIRAAETLDVQVFATTHSLDCLRGLHEAVEAESEFVDLVRLHKVDARLDQAITFSADDLSVAIDQEIEVRG